MIYTKNKHENAINVLLQICKVPNTQQGKYSREGSSLKLIPLQFVGLGTGGKVPHGGCNVLQAQSVRPSHYWGDEAGWCGNSNTHVNWATCLELQCHTSSVR